MSLTAIFANLSCSDLEASSRFFGKIFARPEDAAPMKGLREWHLGNTAGFQLHEDGKKAGQGTLTLLVADVRSEQARLTAAGMRAGEVEEADYVWISRLTDPDGNLVVLAQPKG